MKSIINQLTIIALFLFVSCDSKPSLQKYFVENSENKDFVSLDISPSILKMDEKKMSVAQKEAFQSFEKMNVLAFKVNDKNKAQFEAERAKVNSILKDEKYQQLMKFGSGKEGASVSFVGTDDNIEEFILYGNQKDKGFAVVRVLGKNMNPTSIMEMISILKDSNFDMEQFKPLHQLWTKDTIK